VRTVQNYRSYLLRLWRSDQNAAAWQASLECPLTGQRWVFASLHAMYAYLDGLAAEVQPDAHSAPIYPVQEKPPGEAPGG